MEQIYLETINVNNVQFGNKIVLHALIIRHALNALSDFYYKQDHAQLALVPVLHVLDHWPIVILVKPH
jgi:hypothetical protein